MFTLNDALEKPGRRDADRCLLDALYHADTAPGYSVEHVVEKLDVFVAE